jgi:hypothetical protein
MGYTAAMGKPEQSGGKEGTKSSRVYRVQSTIPYGYVSVKPVSYRYDRRDLVNPAVSRCSF